MARIYLVRHGQASFTADDYDKLSSTGIEQSTLVGRYLAEKNIKPDVIISGSMLRHQETAYHSLAEMAMQQQDIITSKEEDARWNEYDHQNILSCYNPEFANAANVRTHFAKQADPKVAFQKTFVAAIDKWINSSANEQYNESWPQFTSRVIDALNEVAQKYQGKTVLIYSSGGPISVITSMLLGLPLADFLRINLALVNGGITKVVALGEYKDLMLSSFNEHHIFEQHNKKLITYT